MSGTMIFGTLYDKNIPGTSATTTNAKMSIVSAPDPGMTAASVGYTQTLEFENSGADVVENAAKRRVYSMDWNLRESSGATGLDLIRGYHQKLYGPGLIYFADPMNYSTNLLSPQWANPALVEQGWKTIGPTPIGYTNYSGGGTNQPRRIANFEYAGSANFVPTTANSIMVLPIHPDNTLWVGFRALAAGGGVVRVRPILQSGAYDTVVDLTLLSPASSTKLNSSFSGATYKAVEIYLSRTTGTLTSTMDIYSAIAQQWPTGYTPVLTGNWVPGAGANGCKFASDAIVESYVFADASYGVRHYKGMSIDLVETGPWARTGT